VARDVRILFDGFAHHSFDVTLIQVHQVSRSEDARVAHTVLDVNFSVAEDVEASHQEHDTKSG
jgi:hypothetical protein